MDKYLIFSDLHGDVKALKTLLAHAQEEAITLFICAGDVGMHRVASLLEPLPLLLVKGNCDFHYPVPPRYITVDFYGRLLFITHGDLISDWTSCPQSLSERDLFISGHTHKARLIHPKGGPICLNPGSLSSPRDSSPPSYAIVSKEKIEVKSLVDKQVLETLSLTEECQL